LTTKIYLILNEYSKLKGMLQENKRHWIKCVALSQQSPGSQMPGLLRPGPGYNVLSEREKKMEFLYFCCSFFISKPSTCYWSMQHCKQKWKNGSRAIFNKVIQQQRLSLDLSSTTTQQRIGTHSEFFSCTTRTGTFRIHRASKWYETIRLFTWLKQKWHFWKSGFYPANQGCLKTFQIVLISWIIAGPPKKSLL